MDNPSQSSVRLYPLAAEEVQIVGNVPTLHALAISALGDPADYKNVEELIFRLEKTASLVRNLGAAGRFVDLAVVDERKRTNEETQLLETLTNSLYGVSPEWVIQKIREEAPADAPAPDAINPDDIETFDVGIDSAQEPEPQAKPKKSK